MCHSRGVTTTGGPRRHGGLVFAAPVQGAEASHVGRAGWPEEGSALLFWKAAPRGGHPASTAVTVTTSAFPQGRERSLLAVIGGDVSLSEARGGWGQCCGLADSARCSAL